MNNLTYFVEGNEYFLDRNNVENEHYISACAALAFHKALIGLAELNALEKVRNLEAAGGLRISRAVNTYYFAYHLFTSLMLIDDKYKIKLRKKYCRDGKVHLAVKFDDLSNTSELPETWNEFGSLEQDLATQITHTDIKSYCENLRNSTETLDLPHRILFNNFIYADYQNPNTSIKGLYEKLCYVRDRAIYRPSNVLDIDGGYIQTSKHVRKEIDNLPSFTELFQVIEDIYYQILKLAQIKGKNIYGTFSFHLWGTSILEDMEYMISLGYEVSEIRNIKFMKRFEKEELSFSSYITQLIELVDKQRLFSDMDTIWGELIRTTLEYHGQETWYY